MKRIITGIGVGPGDPDLITVGAVKALSAADMVIIPVSGEGKNSVAGGIVESHIKRDTCTFVFPMKGREHERDSVIADQIEKLRPLWEKATTIAVPVIGDATLYATVAWLHEQWKKFDPEIELQLMPGISAHSLASARCEEFLAMAEERLAIIPGTAPRKDIELTLRSCDCAALYKPSALRDSLREVIKSTGPWSRVMRVKKAGLPDEEIFTGEAAKDECTDYLSVLLLWRDRA